MKIQFSAHPSSVTANFLTQKINQETLAWGEASPFEFVIRDESDDIIAGCNGCVIYGSIYTDQLWVAKNYRHQGLARQLMQAVHDYGRAQGCQFASVNTMSFQQARQFYEGLGYTVEFERQGYTQGSSCFFMRVTL